MNGVVLSQIQCVPRSTFSVNLHPSGVCSFLSLINSPFSNFETTLVNSKCKFKDEAFLNILFFQVTCVAGYGGVVDVISQFGSHLCSFRCQAYKWKLNCWVDFYLTMYLYIFRDCKTWWAQNQTTMFDYDLSFSIIGCGTGCGWWGCLEMTFIYLFIYFKS